MAWWDFSDIHFLIFFIITLSVFVLITAFIVSFSVFNQIDINSKRSITRESNTIRIYIIDLKNNNVIYFNKSNIKEKNNITLSQFYLNFKEEDVDKLKNWIYSICIENRTMNDFIEVDMVTQKGKNSYYSILKKIKFDSKVGLLHLESHLMKYISPNNAVIKKNHGVQVGHVDKGTIKELIEKQKNLTGYTFCTRFFYLSTQAAGLDKIERVTIATLKNVVYSFALYSTKPRQIIDEPGNEIVLFDLSMTDKERALKLVANMTNELKKTIGIKGYQRSIGFAIGVVENAQYYQDFGAIYKTVEQACIYAQQHNLSSYFYTRSNKLILSETGKYSQEISRLLKPGVLKYTFKAIVNVAEGETIGYINNISTPESPFKNYNEMTKYSAKVHRNREFFAFCSKNVVSRYASEKRDDNARLFMQASLTDLDFIFETIIQIPQIKECPLTLTFLERDFDEENVDMPTLHQLFDSLKREDIHSALILNDQNILLDPAIYSNFDYFIIAGSMLKEIRKSKFTRLSIHTLVEQLLKYKKPIIATDVEGWQAIELIVNSGITLISSETISPENAMILPIDRRRVDKLKSLANKYQ